MPKNAKKKDLKRAETAETTDAKSCHLDVVREGGKLVLKADQACSPEDARALVTELREDGATFKPPKEAGA